MLYLVNDRGGSVEAFEGFFLKLRNALTKSLFQSTKVKKRESSESNRVSAMYPESRNTGNVVELFTDREKWYNASSIESRALFCLLLYLWCREQCAISRV